jgi:hypothetical protein
MYNNKLEELMEKYYQAGVTAYKLGGLLKDVPDFECEQSLLRKIFRESWINGYNETKKLNESIEIDKHFNHKLK